MKESFSFTVLLVLILNPIAPNEGANVLFFLGVSSYSHRIGVWPLAVELSARGHAVTFVSPFPAKTPHPKITDIVPKSLAAWAASSTSDNNGGFYERRVRGTQDYEWFNVFDWGLDMCRALLDDPDYIDWVNRSEFDLVIVDAFVNECGYGLAYKFGAKVILFGTTAPYPWSPDVFGAPDESSWIPDMVFHLPMEMSFFDRLVSAMVPLYCKYLREVVYFPELRKLLSNKLEIVDMPSLKEIENNVSLVFINQHYGEDYARPLPPNVIPVGGMHIDEDPGKIPQELEDFINKGKSGFIYMSFGSYVDYATFPPKTQEVFLNTLNKFRDIQFIWKQEINRTKEFGENIYTTQWVPQQAILAHPKIKAYITHGGLFGIQEAIRHAVPMIAFPIFADQDYNAVKLQGRGIGIHLDYTSITEPEMETAIHQILTNDKYSQNIARASKAFMDRPESAVESAVFWTEFVLRHDDTSFLRPTSIRQSWWKKRQLDVWALLFAIVFATIGFMFKALKLIIRLATKCNRDSKKLKIN